MTNKVKIVLRNPVNKKQTVDYTIQSYDTSLSNDWLVALKNDILLPKLMLEKTFCFLGFPHTHRNLDYLCNQLNECCETINMFNSTEIWQSAGLDPYVIEEWFSADSVRFNNRYRIAPLDNSFTHDDDSRYLGLKIKHHIMNVLHNHFERLQGTVWAPSKYYNLASPSVKYAIRNLNLLCHELESLILSERKLKQAPEWVRPSQITSFVNVPRRELTDCHREGFRNGYDRRFGEVYMHWTQIGKTLMEVYNDEGAPDLIVGNDPTDITIGSGATCEAINSLKYYSGEFDIEWAKDVTYNDSLWHREHIDGFYAWLDRNGIDYNNPRLSLGYIPIAQVDLKNSFGTDDMNSIWKILGDHLDIYKIEFDGVSVTYDYNWTDCGYHQLQMDQLK